MTGDGRRYYPPAGTVPGVEDVVEVVPAAKSRRVVIALLLGLIGLLVAVSLMTVYVIRVEARLGAFEEFVAGRGELRDAENTRLEDRIDHAVCDIVAEFPSSPAADRIRARYSCPPAPPVPQEAP